MKSATSFSRSGLSDWIIQRVSAVVLAVYFVVIVGWLAMHSNVSYTEWHDFMGSTCMRIFGIMALVAMLAHAWVGLWTVLTDYVTVRQLGDKATFLRFLLQIGMALMVFVILVWGLMIFWG